MERMRGLPTTRSRIRCVFVLLSSPNFLSARVQTKDILEREAEEVKIEVNQINYNRKREHERVGAKLSATESKYWSTLANIDAVGKAVETLAKRVKGSGA
jgi:hypothetical protein